VRCGTDKVSYFTTTTTIDKREEMPIEFLILFLGGKMKKNPYNTIPLPFVRSVL
jgi:hypothetical protein